MKKIILSIGIGILNFIYFFMKFAKTKNKITYISRQYNEETLDFKMIKDEIQNNDPNISQIILTKRLDKGSINAIKYVFHIFRQMYNVATSKILIVDTYCIVASVLKHKKSLKIIQIWHASAAIKKFGYQTIDKNSGTEKQIADTMKMHKNYTYVISPSDITSNYYSEAFNVDKSKIIKFGLPRLDYIKNLNKKENLYKEYPILKDKINILYVPTFRKNKKIKINGLIEKLDTKKYNLIIKLHPLDRKNYTFKLREGIIIDDKFDSYEWLSVTDKLITDYSSLAVEELVLDIPIYFYIYDIDEYIKDPGLNFDFKTEKIGKYAVKTEEELLQKLEEEYDYDALKNFKERYIEVEPGNCTKKFGNFLMELMKDDEKNKKDDKKVCN